jgi:asparagine synthase (glutamine-hydrolysing)
MNGFCGYLTPSGALHWSNYPEEYSPEEHLGCQVLVSGYIADRNRLNRRVGLDSARRPSDGEILAHAFRKWGHSLQAHVLGEYAAFIYDARARTGLLTHDALGLAPLYYTHRSEGLAFATDLADLVDVAASEAIDDTYLADFMAFGFITGERTPYLSIRRLLPGQSLWWSDGQLRELRSWDLADVPYVRCHDDGEYEEQFRALLADGVKSALDPSSATWISLSGGLDSSSIACMAAHSGGSNLAAYSLICTGWPEADEQMWMSAVVNAYNLPWHKVEFEAVLPFSKLPSGFHGEPTQSVIEEELLHVQNQLLGSHGVTVMLTGHAGDAVLCASPGILPTHLADPLFEGNPVAAFRAMAAWRNSSTSGRSYSFWLLRTVIAPAVNHLRGTRMRGIAPRRPIPSWLRRDYARQMQLEKRVRQQVAPRCRQPGRQALWHDLWLMSLATATIPRRRMTFDVRSPLLYRPLVEFMCGIPWEQKLRPQCDRYLQRRALKGVLPELVRQRTCKGNGNPAIVEGLRRSRDWFAYLCDSPMIAERGIVDADQWRQVVRQARVGQTHDDKFFLAAIAVEVWLKQLTEHRARTLTRPTNHSEMTTGTMVL